MVAIRGKSFTVHELAEAGVRRISLATSLYRAAMTGLADAAREIREAGTFGYIDDTMTSADFARYLTE
jgi:2-methylisocitrate lyase-like PEP mutase family enzyme